MTDKKTDAPVIKANGLPEVWSEAKMFGAPEKIPMMGAFMTFMESAIGFGIASAIHTFGATAKYEAKVAILASMELKPLYLIPPLFYLLGNFAVFNAVIYRCMAPCNAPNQYIYKVMNKSEPYVMLEEEGDVGKFNRAQRAYNNIGEFAPLVLSTTLLGGFVYPFPMTVAFGVYCVLRMMYCTGYSADAEGRGFGFGTSQHLVFPTMLGLVLKVLMV